MEDNNLARLTINTSLLIGRNQFELNHAKFRTVATIGRIIVCKLLYIAILYILYIATLVMYCLLSYVLLFESSFMIEH